MYKYEISDKVLEKNTYRGKVINRWRDMAGVPQYQIKFDPAVGTNYADVRVIQEDKLTPYKSGEYSWSYKGLYEDASFQCPVCRTKWTMTEHPVQGKKTVWYDCKKCGKTREQIESENKDRTTPVWPEYV